MTEAIVSRRLDELYSSLPTGSLDRAIFNNLRGFNHRQTPGALPSNKDMPGYIFFTRPQLNMQKENLRNVRKLSMLLNDLPTSMQTYIRCMLDPRLMTGLNYGDSEKDADGISRPQMLNAIDCPLVDNEQAFIPILTNNVVNSSAWPSISLPTFKSKAGLYNESFTMADGRVINNENWDLNVTFRNTRCDPILMLFYVWTLYMSFVFEGLLVPYLDMMARNELDYNTRVYRLVMDYQKNKVTKITACHAAIPVGLPIGDAFAIPGDQTYSDANKEIGMSFACTGVDYFDPIVAYEFNKVVGVFNPNMKDGVREMTMMPVPKRRIDEFNWKGYPHINLNNAELEWFVSMDTVRRVSGETLNAIQTYNADDEIGG